MKVFLISDTHFGTHILEGNKWLNMIIDYFDNFFIPLLKEKSEPGDMLIHLGDLFDNRTHIPINVLNEVDRIISEISEILEVHIIVGNHDIYNKSNNNINSPKQLRWIPNVFLYEKTTIIDRCGKKLVLMPWVDKKEDQISLLIKNSPADYLFCHSDLNGCRMHLNSVAWKNNNKIDISDFGNYNFCYSGHIHLVQENKNFKFIGSPYHLDRNDIGDEKGVFILDIENGEEEFIPNNHSPIFIKVKIETEEDIESLDPSLTSKNYIDLSISNSLLINNRKLRRKLEKILETGSFSRVEYMNDITSKIEVDKTEGVGDNFEINDDINFDDFGELILKYLNHQKWSNDDIKEGVFKEFNNIINIYKQEY